MLRTDDFLQADRLQQVGEVAFAVSKGNVADDDIEKYIDLDSAGRQGRYYRLAAQKLGLIENHDNHSVLTPLGEEFSKLVTEATRLDFLARCLIEAPVFKDALQYIEKTKPSDQQLRVWFKSIYPGSTTTANRRFSTLMNYLKDTGLLTRSKSANQVAKYHGSVAIASRSPETISNKKRDPPATAPRFSSASGVLRMDIDAQKRERASTIHWRLIDAKASFLKNRGFKPYSDSHVDLFSSTKAKMVLYEMKSIDPHATNVLSQIRKAVSQLYEYRYIAGDPAATLAIVTNAPLAKENEWILNYLANDRAIAYEWTEDFQTFKCHSNSRTLLSVFTP